MSQTFDLSRSSVLERFLDYVQVHTSSEEGVEDRFPSSERQKDLGRKLVSELLALGLTDASMDDHGYVFATLPSNLPHEEAARIPVVGLLAHMDTYPGVSGENVRPIVHRNYQGGDLTLPGDPSQTIKASENPELAHFVGDDIVTSDGTTLLGADDKAGIAEIMAALEYMVANPGFLHGTIRVGFTPDEEVGNGTAHFDVARFGAHAAYTLDGGFPGEVEDETFCADSATVTVEGHDVHPGYAKGKMVNALRVASHFVSLLDESALPETTEGRQGYIHPVGMDGNVSRSEIHFILRDFEVEGLTRQHRILEEMARKTSERFSGARVRVEFRESYRNMIYKLNESPNVVAWAQEAVCRAGVEPIRRAIRGGTDGARLSFMGLPTPNLFAGGLNFHSKQEYISVGALRKATETILHLLTIWKERSLA